MTALADTLGQPTTHGLAPQAGETPLLRLYLDVAPVPDPFGGDSAAIRVDPFLDHFNLSTPQGVSIGIGVDTVLDTSYYNCVLPLPDTCFEWEKVSGPPADSISIQEAEVPFLDMAQVHIVEGHLLVMEQVCGDIDGSRDGLVTLSDLTTMVDHLFISLEPLDFANLGNTDGSPDGRVTLSDLTALVDYLSLSLTPVDCGF